METKFKRVHKDGQAGQHMQWYQPLEVWGGDSKFKSSLSCTVGPYDKQRHTHRHTGTGRGLEKRAPWLEGPTVK